MSTSGKCHRVVLDRRQEQERDREEIGRRGFRFLCKFCSRSPELKRTGTKTAKAIFDMSIEI